MNLSAQIKNNLNGKLILILFLITNGVYSIMVFITGPILMKFAHGAKIMDLNFGYSPEYVNALLSLLGQEGRDFYLFRQIPVDMVYPFLSAITYCLIIAYFLNKLGKLNGPQFYLTLLPLLGGLFDYLENMGTIFILNNYPTNPDSLTRAASFFTQLKFIFGIANFSCIIILLLVFAGNRLLITRK